MFVKSTNQDTCPSMFLAWNGFPGVIWYGGIIGMMFPLLRGSFILKDDEV